MVLWTLQFKFQFCVQWVFTEFYAVTVCTASVSLIGISRRSASMSECSNPSPSAAAEDQDLKAMQSHPGGGAGVPQCSGQGCVGIHTTQTCSPTPSAGRGLRSSVWLHSLWEATSGHTMMPEVAAGPLGLALASVVKIM